MDAESSSDEEDDDIGALETNAFASAELATAWGVGALAANPDEDVPLVDEDTSRQAHASVSQLAADVVRRRLSRLICHVGHFI